MDRYKYQYPEYNWPTDSQWESMSKLEQIELADFLIVLSDIKRSPWAKQELTIAQKQAKNLKARIFFDTTGMALEHEDG